MTSTFLATPDNWFDLPIRVAASVESGESLELSLTDSDGRRPLANVALDELQAIHQTFGSWWHALGGDARPASLRAGAYAGFLTESRAILTERAEAVLACPSGINLPAPVVITFPPLHHAVLADPQGALALFKSFLARWPVPSLVAWARVRTGADPAVMRGATRAWLRVVLQKVAVEDELAEALVCLRAVYGVDDATRRELLNQESELLERCDLQHLLAWSRSLGLDRPARTQPGILVPPRRRRAESGEADVTVLVPSYCHEAFIEAALDSVLAQTHSAFHLLMVDDRSSDRTVERAARIDDQRLQIDVNEQRLDLGDSVLRAVDRITTSYVALLNSDDVFHPERLERCLSVLESSETVQVVATGVVPIDTGGLRLAPETVSRLFDGSNVANWIQWFDGARSVDEGADLLPQLLERNFLITSSNIVCRTEFLRSRRDVLQGLKYCLDWQLFLDAAIDGALARVPEELVGYRLHGANTVWFDDARGAAYALEVNRVLASTLRRLLEPSSSRGDGPQLARILDLLASRAAKHSDANGFLLYLVELLGGRTLEQSADRSGAVRRCLDLLSHPKRMTDVAQVSGEESRATSNAARAIAETSREEVAVARGSEQWVREALHRHQIERQQLEADLRNRITALEGSAATAEMHAEENARLRALLESVTAQAMKHAEENARRRGSLESVTAQAMKQAEEIARLRSSPEWFVGDTLWNRAHLSRIGRPAARAVRWLKGSRNRW